MEKFTGVFSALAVLAVLSACDGPAGYNVEYKQSVGTVSEVRITNVAKLERSGDTGDDALAGALAGSLVGAPTLGAIAGASGSKQSVIQVQEPLACAVFLKTENGDILFSSANTDIIRNKFLQACTLVRVGDKLTYTVVRVTKTFTNKASVVETEYQWKYSEGEEKLWGQLIPKG